MAELCVQIELSQEEEEYELQDDDDEEEDFYAVTESEKTISEKIQSLRRFQQRTR